MSDEPLIPEQYLLLAVLQQAISDALAPDKKVHRPLADRVEAFRFLMSEDPRVLGAVWCCDMVGLDARWMRHKLRQGFPQMMKDLTRYSRRGGLHAECLLRKRRPRVGHQRGAGIHEGV
ncbi:MAG: hypothetical protein K0S79_117 [Nitrospira sp.]|jgi:hypothetical protein|nr:hypothetical protein [Nitrospira sp.]